MRIVAIGLGGAGCRIVDSLYAIDRKSSRVACVQGLVVDVDESTLIQLTGIPDTSKVFFPAFDPENPSHPEAGPTATIDIAEIVSRIHNLESGENDAIIICCGLGGSMADIVPHVIAGLRASIVDPIFGLVTLPCLAEGEKHSAKAADDIDVLSPLLDGMILFDNETWYKKTKAEIAKSAKKEKGLAQMLGFGREEPEISPELATYRRLNEVIVRRISLILKAGEFRADGGIDLAEVVLDSGEVLNTMKGMGFITIGYAVEKLPSNPLAFLSLIKPAGLFNEENKKKASRIIELAKQAIYHEVSTPCDMTSAHKALVLVAGPSHELSMQGFMTVRKWIDRSIRGLETRSGDYPVMNTKNVAIIIMLSGLENIPRISELREIRQQSRSGPLTREKPEDARSLPGRLRDTGTHRDEMISLPAKMQKTAAKPHPPDDAIAQPSGPPTRPEPEPVLRPVLPPEPPVHRPHPSPEARPSRTPPAVIPPAAENSVSQPAETGHMMKNPERPTESQHREIAHPERQKHAAQQPVSPEPAKVIHSAPKAPAAIYAKDVARQRIEQELQRQRMIALTRSSSKPARVDPPAEQHQAPAAMVRPKREIVDKSQPPVTPVPPDRKSQNAAPDIGAEPVKKTVIIRKRTMPVPGEREIPTPGENKEENLPEEQDTNPESFSPGSSPVQEPKQEPVELKERPHKAKDAIFLGKNVRDTSGPKVRDQSLLHTNLKPKKPVEAVKHDEPENAIPDQGEASQTKPHTATKVKKQEELSWK